MIRLYYYKGKPYTVLYESKIKFSGIRGILEELGLGDEIDLLNNTGEQPDWIDVVVYQCQYHNPDGKVWVRTKEQFYKLFKEEQ